MESGFNLDNYYALVISISNYKDSRIPKLNYNRPDAEGILEVLTNPNGMKLKQNQIMTLLDDEATRFNIMSAVNKLSSNADKDSTVFIYIAGHGGKEEDRLGLETDKLAKYLLPYDSVTDDLYSSAISNRNFIGLISTIKTNKLVIFMDVSFSDGRFGLRSRDIEIPDHPYRSFIENKGMIIASSFNTYLPSIVDSKLGHGIFAYHLMEALSGKADSNKNGYVTVFDVLNYLFEKVPKTAMQLAGRRQEPILIGDITKDFVIAKNYSGFEVLKKEEVKKRNLIRLSDWYNEGKLNAQQYDLARKIIKSDSVKLSTEEKKIFKLLNALFSGQVSISTFNDEVEIIIGAGTIKKHDEIGKKENDIKETQKILTEREQNIKQIDRLNKSAKLLLDSGKYSDSIEIWKEVLSIDPENQIAIIGIEKAKEDEKKNEIPGLIKEALRSFRKGNFEDAIARWKKVLELDPEHSEALDGLEKSESIIEKNNHNDELIGSARKLYNKGKYDEAIEKWNEVINIDPENRIAIDGIEKAKEEEKKTHIPGLSKEAQRFFNRGNFEDAIAKWKEVLELDPDYDEAIKAIKESENVLNENERKKKKIDELMNKAKHLFNIKDYLGAIEKWTEILDIDHNNQIAKNGIEEAKGKNEENEKEKKIIRLLKDAQRLFEDRNYASAVNKWNEVLKSDSLNSVAIEGVEKSERILKDLEEKVSQKNDFSYLENTSNVKPALKAYGVVIGIGEYQDSQIPTLKYARDDAQEIYNILTNPEHGNFPKENVKLLLDKQATLTNIKSAMGTFLRRNAGENDMVCIYFAGHGSPEIDSTGKADDNLEKFLVPYDAMKDDLFATGFSMDDFKKIFGMIESKKVIFLIDSCYSGQAGGRTFSKQEVAARNISISEKFLEELSGQGRIIISASLPDELSFESDDLKHGIFTYYLAEGLKGKADLDKDGVVTVDELYKYVFSKVTEKARLFGAKQHPLKKGTIIGEIPLTRYETEKMRTQKELLYHANQLVEQGKDEEAVKKYEDILIIDKENSEALASIDKLKKNMNEHTRKKNLKILSDLYYEGKLSAAQLELTRRLIKSSPEDLSKDDKKVLKLLKDLLADQISISTFIEEIENIT